VRITDSGKASVNRGRREWRSQVHVGTLSGVITGLTDEQALLTLQPRRYP
jgi:hypothetical protein